jgi:murein DD-endopeptidase MepM/ murein hydrolase activator NlpD
VPQPTERARESAESGLPQGVFHVVEPGQTLWRIARVYDVPLDELSTANGIDDPSRLESGRAILIPGAPEILDVAPWPAPLAPSPGAVPSVGIATGFVWPLAGGRVLSRFGEPRRTHRHAGLDIAGRRGQRIVAAAPGRVIYSDNRMRGYGHAVILDHGEGFQSLYAHNSRLLVRAGDEVAQGEPIAVLGKSGNATGEHCHFEIRKDRVPVDPLPYLSWEQR